MFYPPPTLPPTVHTSHMLVMETNVQCFELCIKACRTFRMSEFTVSETYDWHTITEKNVCPIMLCFAV